MKFILLCFVSFILLGCFGDCPPYGEPGIRITVFDGASEAALCGALITATLGEDEYVAVIPEDSICESSSVVMEFDEEGYYSVSVEVEGYETFSVDRERITKPNRCGGENNLVVELNRIL